MSQHPNAPSSISQVRDRLLSIAAMFKDEFSIDWLMEISRDKPSQILEVMEEGIKEGWLQQKGPGLFTFVDADKREHIRQHSDKKSQNQLHSRIADLIFNELPDGDRKILTGAYHLLHIQNDLEKCGLLMQAGDLLIKSFRTNEAVKCYHKVLDDLADATDEVSHQLFIETAIRSSKLSLFQIESDRLMAALHEAMKRATKIGHLPYQALLKMHLARTENLRGRESSALRLFEEGWKMAENLDNPRLMKAACAFRIFFYYWQGRFKQAIEVYEKTVPDVEQFPHGRFPLLASMLAGYCYVHYGRVTQGLGIIDAIRSSAKERGDRVITLHAEICVCEIMVLTGRYKQAIKSLKSMMKEAVEIDFFYMMLSAEYYLAYAYFLENDIKSAERHLRECLQKTKEKGMSTFTPTFLLEICLAMEQGKFPEVSDLKLEKVIPQLIKGKNVSLKGACYRYQAHYQKIKGLPDEKVYQSLRSSVDFLQESGNHIELGKTQIALARHFLSTGDQVEAQTALQSASKILSVFNKELVPNDLKFLLADSDKEDNLLKEIFQLGQELATIRDYKELVRHIITTVNRITGAERGAIFFWDTTSHHSKTELWETMGITSDDVERSGFKPSLVMIHKVIASKKGSIESADQSTPRDNNDEQFIRSRICVPLILRDKVKGVLYHDIRLLNSIFKESDLELLAYFASQAAIALDNSEAYARIQREYEQVSEEKQYFEEQHQQKLHFEDIVGESMAIRQLLTQIEQVAATDTTVLILGETGVGKELVASAIHRHSPRSQKPIIRVHCSAMPGSLIPSELFGHEKGAFTGATQRRTGRFELAHKGTIFLDEVGDLDHDVQVRLLRILQNKQYERIGGSETLTSDFRLIAATNRNLEEAVKAGTFRADLYYRLNVFPILVPSLRERTDDIPLLASHFLKIYSNKVGKRFEEIAKEEINKLLHYDWPGNIRELENIIERSTILSTSPNFFVTQLKTNQPEFLAQDELATLEEVERRHIITVLGKSDWKVRGANGAAKILGLKPTTLDYRMKKLGITRQPKRNKKNRLVDLVP